MPVLCLTYGDVIHLKNMYYEGSYLDTCGYPSEAHAGQTWDVSTTESKDRDKGTGSWVVESAEGKEAGEVVVRHGDKIHLKNLYYEGSYLDTHGYSTHEGQTWDVTTTESKDRDNGTGIWQIESAAGDDEGSPVRRVPERSGGRFLK